jgi:hypothetical protein
MPEELYRCQAKAIHQTEKAVLVEIDDEKHWIPQNQIHDDSEVWKKGDVGELVITQWIAEKCGLV